MGQGKFESAVASFEDLNLPKPIPPKEPEVSIFVAMTASHTGCSSGGRGGDEQRSGDQERANCRSFSGFVGCIPRSRLSLLR